MKFWKMNGAGNDFIMINNFEENIPHDRLPEIARILCERHMSIGADGLMAVDRPSEGVEADCRMLFFNSDGSAGEMCGNGARCITRYCFENNIGDGGTVVIETTAGIVSGKRVNKQLYRVKLNDPSVIELYKELDVDGHIFTGSYVELGSPGLPVLAVDYTTEVREYIKGPADLFSADRAELFDLGRKLRFHPDLPKGANVNFYRQKAADELDEMTYERGVEDFTYACGTGTGATVAALTVMGRVSGDNVKVNMRGGVLYIDVEEIDAGSGGRGTEPDGAAAAGLNNARIAVRGLYLTGPTNIVCKGEVTDENLTGR